MVEPEKKRKNNFVRLAMIVCLAVITLTACSEKKIQATITPTPSPAVDPSLFPPTPTEIPIILQATPTIEQTTMPEVTSQATPEDIMVVSLAENGHDHLFAYQPVKIPFTRLTSGDFDDRDPVISPDGTRIAFSSNRSGYWDIYVLDITAQNLSQITVTNQYDGSPAWSPDGQWLTYESYNGKNLNVVIQSVSDPTVAAIQLTDNSGNNYAPKWSPAGREVAFVTDRSGSCEIWTARLDTTENRFALVVGTKGVDYTSPSWSADGNQLAWVRTENGASQVQTASQATGYQDIRSITDGNKAIWSPDGKALLIQYPQPNSTYFSAVFLETGLLLYPAQSLPGAVHGMDWQESSALNQYVADFSDSSSLYSSAPAWQASISSTGPEGRHGLIELQNVDAPYPYLQDAADEAFAALRTQSGTLLGWDFLANLDDATLPLTSAPEPGINENWLYTGRAIAVNSVPLQADWLTVTREDFNGKTYWHLWVKCLKQDGSCGEPQRISTWDFSARYSGDKQSYENGGAINDIPAGYWVDFTVLASQFGWERLPAETNWRSYFPGTLFNQFILRQGLTWDQAMLEVYPDQALQKTPSAVQP